MLLLKKQISGSDTPTWIMLALVLPLVISARYLLSILSSQGTGSMSDRIAGTKMTLIIRQNA